MYSFCEFLINTCGKIFKKKKNEVPIKLIKLPSYESDHLNSNDVFILLACWMLEIL